MTVEHVRVGTVLELQRRTVDVVIDGTYEEIGIRSFGRGVFHKEPVPGVDLGSKRVFRIEPGDLLLSNVFAWEGAIAVAGEAERGKIGSHRFMTYTPISERIDTTWASWFFRSEPGLELIRQASPGSAGRNRTLAIGRFEDLEIPLPGIDEQRRVGRKLDAMADAVDGLLRIAREVSGGHRSLVSTWLRTRFTGAPVTKLGQVCDVFRGRGPVYEVGSGHLAVNQSCVRWDGLDLAQAREVSEAWWEAVPEDGRVRDGDVLINSTGEGTIGRAVVAPASAARLPFDSHVLAVRCDRTQILPGYLAAYIRSPAGQMQIESLKGANTTKQTELGKSKLESLTIPVAPLPEQNAFLGAYAQMLVRQGPLLDLSDRRMSLLIAMLPATLRGAFAGLG